jgi:predicted metal-dependent hydrolase
MSAHATNNAALLGESSQPGLWDDAMVRRAWCVRASSRARRMTARVFHDGRVEIVVPAGSRERAVARFVERHRQWIEATLQKAQQRTADAPALMTDFPPLRLQLTALDEWLPEQWLRPAGTTPLQLREQLRERLRLRARAGFLPLLTTVAQQLEVDFARLQVRWQRSRWGSCSRRGTISLNACLLFQRPAVLRYLMVHELSHRRHMNHSAAFWRHVATHEPEWRVLDRELARGWQQVPRWILNAAAVHRQEL